MRSAWFASAAVEGGRIVLPGKPRRHAALLALSSDGIELRTRRASVELAWDDHSWRRAASGECWGITEFALGRGGPIGVAVYVEGGSLAKASATVRAMKTLRNRMLRLFSDGVVIPLNAAVFATLHGEAEHDTLKALCDLLARDVDRRRRLDDHERCRRLVADLTARALRSRPERSGVRRSTMEILTAMHLMGLVHPLGGRPLPWDQLRPTVDLVQGVLGRVQQNPYARDVGVSEDDVRSVVEREYSAVEPWPFEALT